LPFIFLSFWGNPTLTILLAGPRLGQPAIEH
jgi:hypothetical protein